MTAIAPGPKRSFDFTAKLFYDPAAVKITFHKKGPNTHDAE